VKFFYNRAPSCTALHSPFECMYEINPLTPINFLPIPSESRVSYDAKLRAKEMKKLLEQIGSHIEKANNAYKDIANKHRKNLESKLGDLVWLRLRKERFPSKTKNKVMSRGDGPFKIIERL